MDVKAPWGPAALPEGGRARPKRPVGAQGALGNVGRIAPSRPEAELPGPARPADSGLAPRPVLGSGLTPPPRRGGGQQPWDPATRGRSRASASATWAEKEAVCVVPKRRRDGDHPEPRRRSSLREGIGF